VAGGGVVGFQTRIRFIRHEYYQKCALEMLMGLLLHPLSAKQKPTMSRQTCACSHMSDIGRILSCLAHDPFDHAAAMRYGRPREAVFHALIRKNYAVSHFIVRSRSTPCW